MGDGLQDGHAEAGRANGQGTALHTAAAGWRAGAAPPGPEPGLPTAAPAGDPEATSQPRPSVLRAIVDFFPHGNTLDEEVFRKRHNFLSLILAVHLPALYVFGLWRGFDPVSTAYELAIPFVLLIFGRVLKNRRLEAFFITGGLVYCSSALVHLSGGTIEAHFHFFVLIGLIALYQDWVPFAWNFAFTVLSHGLGSAIDSDAIFNHHAAQQNPWLWAAIHGISVAVACVGVTIFWRSTEQEQQRSNQLARELASAELAAAQTAAAQRESISELFVNLARRNQTLLNRQLELIADLEQRERRPEELGELFKLDHLATRIRRNAESLLVLSGDDPPRRWGRPVALGDVVRAAAAEVEDYKRVEVLVSDHLEVVGRAVADLAHMLAELIENATTFSPPGSEVRIRSHLSPGENSNYVLSIEDVGIGMSDADLIAANELLADPPDIDPRRSRLGFHVVSRLAQRYGLRVTLASTPGGGVTAMVMLPHDLVTERRPAISVGSGTSLAGHDVYALPATATPVSPLAPEVLAARGLGTAPAWPEPAPPAAPGAAGLAAPPAEGWQAPPPIPPRLDLTGDGPAIPRETWEIEPSDTPSRPVIPTSWQSPPPIPPQEPVAPAHVPGVEAPLAPEVDVPAALADDGLGTAPPAVTDPSDALLRGRPRFRPSPDRWGPAPDPTPPADDPEPEADAVAATPTIDPAPVADDAVAEVAAAEEDGTAAEAAEAAEDPAAEATSDDEVVEAEVVEDEPEADTAAATDDDVVDAEVVEEVEDEDEDEAVEVEVAEDATDAPEPVDLVAPAPIEEPILIPLDRDEMIEPPPVEPQPSAEPAVEVPAAAAPPADPWGPPVPPGPPADFAPVPPPPPFVVMPPVPSPPVEHPPVPEVPAASMAPPPPAPAVPPPPPAPFEVAPSDEVARPFVDFGAPPDDPFPRPSYSGWPPTLRTQPDPSAVPPFLVQPPPPAAAPPPGPGGPTPRADDPPAVTADGLVKRVPGARLAAGLQSRRSTSTNGGPAAEQFDPPQPDARRQRTSSMLSRFQAMQRDGRAAAESADAPPDPEETS